MIYIYGFDDLFFFSADMITFQRLKQLMREKSDDKSLSGTTSIWLA